jgi:hypothetical protein
MEDLGLRLRRMQELVDRTTQLCEASESLCAESDALCKSTRAAVVSAWEAVDRHRQLRVREISVQQQQAS